MNKSKALYPGSFDPVTRWHEDIIKRANDQFDLHVWVAVNPGKNSTFTLQEKVRLIQAIMPKYHIDPSKVIRIASSTARWMKRLQINTIVRGQRNIIDELDESILLHFNVLEYPELQTHVFEAEESLQFASSSAAKMLIRANHDPSSIISLSVQEALASRILWQYPIYIAGWMWAGKSTVAKSMILEARKIGINAKHIELDKIAHDIYTTLTDPMYASVRDELRHVFGDHISPDGNWIDRRILSGELKNEDSFDWEKLRKLDSIVSGAIEFRYKDMIEWFQWIIIIDGIIKEWLSFARFAHNNVMFVDAVEDVRLSRVMDRYEKNQDPKSVDYIKSMMHNQLSLNWMENIIDVQIARENHGSVEIIDNSWDELDFRKIFFQLLNQIDRYGEFRTTYILSLLGIEWNMREHLNFLQSKYNEPHRYYHSWEHIIECLSLLFEMAIELSLSDEDISIIGWAILGHDLVYVIDREMYPQNEEMSQKIWTEYLEKKWVNKKNLKKISRLIFETRHGRVKIGKWDQSQILHDIDMSILGTDSARYRQYVSDIRSEFAPMMSGINFDHARREQFLIPVLDSGWSLFKTEYVRDIYGPRVMDNLRDELNGKI